jgi:hypothetical protein
VFDPTQVVKTRLQAATERRGKRTEPHGSRESEGEGSQGGSAEVDGTAALPPEDMIGRLIRLSSAIYAEHGIAGFYLGLDAKLIQTALTAAILFVCRDAINRRLRVGGPG